ncbi:MAG: FUSC family protein [Deltaproteobacteria bacterium]|nr:FUSC family protein [Deltaproteobacteria bacterium]
MVIRVGVDQPPPTSRTRARSAMEALTARIIEVRPAYISRASSAEVVNFGSFTDSLAVLTTHIERLLDEPPQPAASAALRNVGREARPGLDFEIVQYSLKVGMSAVIGYVIGITSQRPEMSTILTTVLITALPSYGASVRKMILRIVGGMLGGAVSLLAIIIVTPNFESLPSYLLALFVVFYVSAYSSLASARIAYAGKQIGTVYALVFAGLSPSLEIYPPLWRIWSVLLGSLVVAVVGFSVWPEYAGDALLPRLRRVIRDTLELIPGSSATNTEAQIQQTNADTMLVLAEMLQIADDAQMEGRRSIVNHDAIVDAVGTLRRIANRLASIGAGHIINPRPQLDPATELDHAMALYVIRNQLQSWLEFFSRGGVLSPAAAEALARAHSSADLKQSLEQFISRVEEANFERIESWTLEQRRAMLAEIQSLRRLEVLIGELNRWLPQIPGPALKARSSMPSSQIARGIA